MHLILVMPLWLVECSAGATWVCALCRGWKQHQWCMQCWVWTSGRSRTAFGMLDSIVFRKAVELQE